MNSETFLAFDRSSKGAGQKPTLEVGVTYDVALQIDGQNSWLEAGEMDHEMINQLIAVAARGLSELIQFCWHGQTLDRKGKGIRVALRRFIAVSWMLHSELLVGADGKPLSLRQLGDLPQVDCTRCALSLLAQEFGDKWGFRARVQKRKTTKPHYAHAAKKGWKKRRRRIRDRANYARKNKKP